MEFTVENICGLLIRSKLLTADEVRTVYQGWVVDAKDAATNVPQFTRWLAAKRHVTEYQAKLLSRGQVDDFFLGDYKILDRLGQGRMAGVYKAVHESGQLVAIKVLPPSRAANLQIVARFQREARLAMRMKHPNVVRAFQLAETKGLHYLVMEYLEGETLEEVLYRRNRLPVNEAVRVVYQALLGLQHIHEQKLVHRDLKPANLMLVPAAPPGGPDSTLQSTVVILDFGLGRALLEEAGAAAPHLTSENVLLGTPDYLAPEQARDPRTIDVRADIYSLGGVLYHCLAGQPPFPDSNILGQMVRHATEAPRPLKEANPAVPDGLQRVLDWMLAKDPAQRYPTPERAAQALQVFLVAGPAPAKTSEEEARMRSYLSWLEKAEGAAPPDGRPAPPPMPSPPPMPMPLKRDSKPETKKLKPVKGPKTPVPPPARPLNPSDFDVELVIDEPAPKPAAAQRFALSARDWLMLGIGAGAVIAAGVLGWALSLLARAS